jgi:glycosyltransferase involved in cell wall biosynthesis
MDPRPSGGETAPRTLKLAVAAIRDPESPKTWSGTPAGIIAGLRELGVVTSPLSLALPARLEQAMVLAGAPRTRKRVDAQGAALTVSVRGLLARRRLDRATIDGVVQIGGGYFTLPPGTAFVTLEDMTLRQARGAHRLFSGMTARGVERRDRHCPRIYSRARMCTMTSHWAAESLLADYGLPPERVAVVGLGATHTATVRERDWAHPRFLFVGIDWERKGGPAVLNAFSQVRRVYPDAVLDVVGGHPRLQEPGVTGHGILSRAGARQREIMLDLFARATCFVMPSSIEPFGIVYIEAASAGLASIAGSVGGARDLIGDDGGLLVEPNDQAGLVDAMLQLADPDTARRMGQAARERSTQYTWTKVAERLLRALGLPAPDGRALADFL